MTEVYLLFYQAVLQLFVNFNKFLQREHPIIPVVANQMSSFLKKLFGKFVTIGAIRSAPDITMVQYIRGNQLQGRQATHAIVFLQFCERLNMVCTPF